MIDIAEAMDVIKRHQDAVKPDQKDASIAAVPIADELGINVYKINDWPKHISGMVKKDKRLGGKSGYAIFVNGKHPQTRRRFTIAHEIAHCILHQNLIGDGITDDALYRSGLTSSVETQANKLAANILMPWDKIIKELENGANSVGEIAKKFNVSKSAMSIRLGVPYE